jgi:hypothetical protein
MEEGIYTLSVAWLSKLLVVVKAICRVMGEETIVTSAETPTL